MTQALATAEKKDLVAFIKSEDTRSKIAAILPRHCDVDKAIGALFVAMNKEPKLAQCTRDSLFASFQQLNQVGLPPDGRVAHLIPRYNKKKGAYECTAQLDYKGLLELVYRSGKVKKARADMVCENDLFDADMGNVTLHKIDYRKPRGLAFAFYAHVIFHDGTEFWEIMSREDIEEIKARSESVLDRDGNESKYSPWVRDFPEMGKKTVFKRLTKWLPLSPEDKQSLNIDDEPMINITPSKVAAPTPIEELRTQLRPPATPRQPQPIEVAATPEPEPEPVEVNQEPAAEPPDDLPYDNPPTSPEIVAASEPELIPASQPVPATQPAKRAEPVVAPTPARADVPRFTSLTDDEKEKFIELVNTGETDEQRNEFCNAASSLAVNQGWVTKPHAWHEMAAADARKFIASPVTFRRQVQREIERLKKLA